MSNDLTGEVDLEAVRARYDSERDRRIRAGGIGQYIEVTGDFTSFVEDPYVSEVPERAPLEDLVGAIVIGGGFGGLLAGAHLRKAGFDDIRIVEKAGDFGGTWYWNRYPGVQCDVDATIYLPLLEETGYMPSLKYTFGDEIHAYTKLLAEHFELYRDACFQTEVTEARWLDEEQVWQVSTDRGDAMRAKYLCMANGPLHKPKLPGVEGIDRFAGHTFHTTRWDYAYTGGGLHGGLDKLSDKRVAIVGTGATALQCVPHLGEAAEHLYVVQRTPSSVDERNNHETDADWFGSLEPGWQQKRADNFTKYTTGVAQPADLIGDGWTDLTRNLRSLIDARRSDNNFAAGSALELAEFADYQSMERIRRRVDSEVDDPATADLLKAHYRKMCKRPAFHDEFLATFNRGNVTLVDTDGQGLTRVTESAIVVGEIEYEIDCLIFATGFEVGTAFTRRAGYEIFGRDGLALSEKWANGPQSQFGLQTRNFPNAFFVGPEHGTTSINVTQTLNEQAQHLAHVISNAERVDATEVDVAADAEHAWGEALMDSGLKQRRAFLANCTPGYYNGESHPEGKGSRFAFQYSAGPWAFFDILRAWRSVNHLPGIEVDGQVLEPSSEDLAFLRSEPAIRVQLHRQTRLFLEQRDAAGARRLDTMSIAEAREGFSRAAAMSGRGPDLASVEDLTIESAADGGPTIPIRVYRPAENTGSIVLYFHGGGGCIGSVDTADAAVRQLAEVANATVVSVGYRLAPEAPFPAGVHDATSALRWTQERRAELADADAGLFVCGDSLGGTLATVAAMTNRDEQGPLIAGQILIYPWVDNDPESADLDQFEAPILTKEELLWFRSHYAPAAADPHDPRLNPTHAESFADLPPALVLTAEFDLLCEQGKVYAAKLELAGVDTHHKVFPGAVHGFFTAQVGLLQSTEATADIADFITRHSQRSAPQPNVPRDGRFLAQESES